MPHVPYRARLVNGAIDYARTLQRRRRQQEQDDDGFASDEQSSLSSLSSLSSVSSLSSSGEQEEVDEMMEFMEPMEIDGELVWMSDGEEDGFYLGRFQQLQVYMSYILSTRVLNPNEVHKFSQLHLVLVLYKNDDHIRFRRNLRVSPATFDELLSRVHDHSVFVSTGNRPQLPVNAQLAITLYRFGHFGNAASVESIAQWAGVSAGVVVKSTRRVMIAFHEIHDEVMRWATPEEKEEARNWVERASCRAWRNGYAMVDGTLIPLADKPGFHGEAYFDRKSNYSFNLQLVTLPSMRIIDYVLGHCGSAHDSTAFQDSRAYLEHEELFQPAEWLWADSAYSAETWCITPYKKPASDIPENATFNYWVSRVRIRSEHAMGFLKGRFQSLKGLRQQIKDECDHRLAIEWIRTCLILHTLIHDIETDGNRDENDFNAELIELGLEEDSRLPNGGQDSVEDAARESPGQKWRKEVKRRLFASGITGSIEA